MSSNTNIYSFLPWLRQGIANNITAEDFDSDVKLRATIEVKLNITGNKLDGGTLTEPILKNIQMFGPCDIVGIDSKTIIKNEPRNWITNFEPNYLPYIDFYDEDFPWRYTPAAPDESLHRLRPWIMLVVLKEGEFEEGKNIKNKPLPYIKVDDAASLFPPADQLWAWAHIHVNSDLTENDVAMSSTDMDKVLPEFEKTLNENPDLAYARIVCPRKLEENAAYHAFLVPVFESGRLAGLGIDPSNVPDEIHATFSAWAPYPTGTKEEPAHFPIYHRWYFRTGTAGDFEYLVRLLEAKPMDTKVGKRDMDVTDPGYNISGITNPELGGILKLGGALRIPKKDIDLLSEEKKAEITKYDNWDQPYPHKFQKELAEFINLADEYSEKSAEQANSRFGIDENTGVDELENDKVKNDPDPLITPPLYGRWHALTQRLLKDKDDNTVFPDDNWIHKLNLDPCYRVPAGFGTKVVRENQEEYMNAAWEQIGDVLEANRKIRQGQLSNVVSSSWYVNHLIPLAKVSTEKAFLLTAPVQKRIIKDGITVYHHVNTSVVPYAITSPTARRILRPNARLMKSLKFDDKARPDNLIERINSGEVSAAPEKAVPEVATVSDLSEALMPKGAPSTIINWLRKFSWLRFIPLLIALLILLLLFIFKPGGLLLTIGSAIVAVCFYLLMLLSKWSKQIQQADSIREENQTPESVDDLPKSPDFVLSKPGDNFKPTIGNTDSEEALRFKAALKDLNTVLVASAHIAKQPEKHQIDLKLLTDVVIKSINPEITIPRMVFNNISLPAYMIALLGEEFKEAMAYPEFDIPMYKPLVDISSELFLPNINYVPQNSITLLETNQKFIESYMVGINHEFARELLWREYPTDQRGSYFRQFWSTSSYLDEESLTEEELREKLKDIPRLDRWSKYSNLGDHDHREQPGENKEDVVLVIRGELLKKYPTAVIYAHKAKWQTKDDGTIDNEKSRVLVELTKEEEEADCPPRTKIKTPLYEAKVEPDIYFFGFDLTAEEAKGGLGISDEDMDDAGWFFVIKERPGEPRFGLDIASEGAPAELNSWNDLTWEHVLPGAPAGKFIEINNSTTAFPLVEPQDIKWDKDTNSADLAYILYQVPVMVAVHAAEMLK
jgi:hypothetical protein